MRTERALEILNSPDTFLVTHKDHAVWINHIDSGQQTANVKDLTTCSIKDVPIVQLEEPDQE